VETRKYHVVSSEVNAFAVVQNGYADVPYQLHSLRLIRPDDSVGNRLLLCLPSTVVHEIDAFSPLAPPTKADTVDAFPDTAVYSYKWPSSRQRVDDSASNNRPAFMCIVCGESYASEMVLRRHASSCAAVEAADAECTLCLVSGEEVPWDKLTDHYAVNYPTARFEDMAYNEHWLKGQAFNHANIFDNRGCRHDGFDNVGPHRYSREEIQEWMRSALPEVICIIGAVDAATGSNLEVHHSYTIDDIEWDAKHLPCVFADPETQVATVDFEKFLQTTPSEPVPLGGLTDGTQFHL